MSSEKNAFPPNGVPAPKISVIVPVYNVEKYLRECIDSVLAQTFTDFELILVDDGSPDNSGAICDEYRSRDSRIQVIHKPNGGVSSARNAGIERSRGEWITFVDSDDWIAPQLLEKLLALQAEYQADISLCSYAYVDEQGQKTSPRLNCRLSEIEKVGRVEAMRRVHDGRFYEGSPFCRIFSRSKIEHFGIRFAENIAIGEDWLFSTEYFSACVNCAVSTQEVLYFYRTRAGSAMQTGKGAASVIVAADKILSLLLDRREEYASILSFVRVRVARTYYSALLASQDASLPNLKKVLRRDCLSVLLSSVSLKMKLGFLCAAISPKSRLKIGRKAKMGKKIFVTYADEAFRDAGIRIIGEAKETGEFDRCELVTPQDIPDFVKASPLWRCSRGGGYWIWKPWVILHAMNFAEEGDIIFYADAGCQLYRSCRWKAFFEHTKKNGFLFFRIGGKIKHWVRKTLRNTFPYGNDSNLICAGTMMMTMMMMESRNLMKKWGVFMVEHPECVGDVDPEERGNEDAEFIENRHDQATLTGLLYEQKKRMKKCVVWESFEQKFFPIWQPVWAARNKSGETRKGTVRFFRYIFRHVVINSWTSFKLFLTGGL